MRFKRIVAFVSFLIFSHVSFAQQNTALDYIVMDSTYIQGIVTPVDGGKVIFKNLHSMLRKNTQRIRFRNSRQEEKSLFPVFSIQHRDF